jgi:hypothetical protein
MSHVVCVRDGLLLRGAQAGVRLCLRVGMGCLYPGSTCRYVPTVVPLRAVSWVECELRRLQYYREKN